MDQFMLIGIWDFSIRRSYLLRVQRSRVAAIYNIDFLFRNTIKLGFVTSKVGRQNILWQMGE